MLPTFRAEIVEILQGLKQAWPLCDSMTWLMDDEQSSHQDFVDRYLAALQWLTDMGLITFEALTVGPTDLSIRQAALTSRGREFIRSELESVADSQP